MLFKNTSLYFVGELVNRASKLLSLYLIARIMSKAGFGQYSYILSICLVAMVFLDFGLNTLVMLRTTRARFAHLLPMFFLGKLVTVTGFCVVLIGYDLLHGFWA